VIVPEAVENLPKDWLALASRELMSSSSDDSVLGIGYSLSCWRDNGTSQLEEQSHRPQ